MVQADTQDQVAVLSCGRDDSSKEKVPTCDTGVIVAPKRGRCHGERLINSTIQVD
jgi:hypothetical protein